MDHERVVAQFRRQLERQARQYAKAHATDLKNVKNLAIHESVDYVKKSSAKVAKQITKEHQHIARQFLHFKERTWAKMDRMDQWHEEMKELELALALKNPVLEAEYILNTRK